MPDRTMHSTDTISVVIPAYNAEKSLRRAIDSVLAQTRPVYDVIVVDDGSRDDTAAVGEVYGGAVRVIRQANAGPGAARNRGAEAAQGEWIALLDADDAWLPQKLERQAEHFAQSDVGIVHSYVIGMAERYQYEGELTFDSLWELNRIGTSTVIVRKAAWEAVGGFEEDRSIIGAEDYNFWLRLVSAGWRVACCREDLSEYTPPPDSLSTNIDRVLGAELENAERIGARVGMPSERIRRKQAQLYAEYGVSMLHASKRAAARKCLSRALLRCPSLSSLGHWAATFAPDALLDWRRSRRQTEQRILGDRRAQHALK
jgi:cellulose synthase/poly-beta-1,6-N-acetylglucosamine synthase-like glycosyltransferase